MVRIPQLAVRCAMITVIFVAGCVSAGAPREHLNYNMPGQWKFDRKYSGNDYQSTLIVFAGKSISEWTESLEIFNFKKSNYPPDVEAAFNLQIDIRKRECPDSVSQTISKDSYSILYETNTTNCHLYPDEHSLTRILYGKTDVFVMTYTNRIKELPPEKREEWIKYLSGATIKLDANGR